MGSYLREQNANEGDEHHPQGGDYADGDTGGPDFWEITGVPNNDLGLKAEPSLNSQFRVRNLHNGTLLRNLGCENHGGDRWCRVEVRDNPSQNGWARMQYLRESSGSTHHAEVSIKSDSFKSVCGVVNGPEMYKYPCQVVDQYNGKTKARTILRYPDMELVLVWLPNGQVEVSGSAGGNSEPETVNYTVKSGETNFKTKKASYFYMSDKKVAARELSQLKQ
jgi:hypothetical protein